MTPYFMATEETLNRTPPEVREYLRLLRRRIQELEATDPQRRIAELEATIRKLQVQVEDLQAALNRQQEQGALLRQQLADAAHKLNTNSSNSSLPPSSDRFRGKRRPPPPADQPRKKAGGQPGHPPAQRPLVPDEEVRERIPCKPSACRRCGSPLTGDDPQPLRHQVAELPVVRPDVVEYQLHRLKCPCCQTSTCGPLPAGVRGQFGPRLQATVALLAGRYRLGLRGVAELARDLWGLTLSTGTISELRRRTAQALFWPQFEVALHVRGHNVNIDETTWREGKKKVYLWAAVTQQAALYHIAAGRGAAVAKKLLGADYSHVATCDRLKSYWWIKWVQWCWAHLRRDFQAMIDRGDSGRPIGERLLGWSNKLFHFWHQYRKGQLPRAELQKAMKPVRQGVREALQDGRHCGCVATEGTCRELLSHEQRLWTFVEKEGVEPTNNDGERAERQGVLWRKISGGTASVEGSQFVERVLTVAQTCRRQGKNLLEYLHACIDAWRHGREAPSLLANTS
jgi:transposase